MTLKPSLTRVRNSHQIRCCISRPKRKDRHKGINMVPIANMVMVLMVLMVVKKESIRRTTS